MQKFLADLMVEVLKKRGKRRNVAGSISIDIDKHMREIMRLNNNIAALPSAKDERQLQTILDNLENFSNFYSDKEFIDLTPKFNVLPRECSKKIKDFYGETKILSNILKKKLITKDIQQIYNSWASYCPQTYAIGLKTLICLFKNVFKNKQIVEEIESILRNHEA